MNNNEIDSKETSTEIQSVKHHFTSTQDSISGGAESIAAESIYSTPLKFRCESQEWKEALASIINCDEFVDKLANRMVEKLADDIAEKVAEKLAPFLSSREKTAVSDPQSSSEPTAPTEPATPGTESDLLKLAKARRPLPLSVDEPNAFSDSENWVREKP